MRAARGFVLSSFVSTYAYSQSLQEQYPWYHSSDSIHAELEELSKACNDVSFNVSTHSAPSGGYLAEEVHLDVVRVSRGSPEDKLKAFFVFGEHARELISPESGLAFLRMLCGKGEEAQQGMVNRVLETTSFTIIPNANPLGRKMVEAGNFCKRANEDGVDLNRNWGDAHRDSQEHASDPEMNPGPHGFSEIESRTIKDLVVEVKPTIFVSVHSGAYLLGTPFGYTASRTADNEQQMLDLLKPISQDFCEGDCPYGNLAGLIGYNSKGCDIDYIKEELHTPYVFTWEIYAGKEVRDMYAEQAHAHAENREMNADARVFFHQESSLGLLQRKQSGRLRGPSNALQPEGLSQKALDDCFWQFNPETQEETEAVSDNWAVAFLTLCDTLGKNGTAPT